MLPKIAEGDANKVWIVPSEIGKALEGLGSTMNRLQGIPDKVDGPRTRVDMGPSEPAIPEDVGAEDDPRGGGRRDRGRRGVQQPARKQLPRHVGHPGQRRGTGHLRRAVRGR